MNAAPLPASDDARPSDRFRCGTLTYTRMQLAALFFWLLWGDFCFVLMETVVPSLMPLKFQALSASNATIGLILVTVPMSINTVFNPVISFRSDRFRSSWGRRIPFILVTMPLLVFCLVGLGFADQIGLWLHGALAPAVASLSPTTVIIGVFAGVMILFSFFNTFVNSVFWYLFNDVVPPQLLARFMSVFRMVSLGSAALYNLLIFPHAVTHFREILFGASALYFVGFGLMCLNVKEGEYPLPPEPLKGRNSLLSAVRTFFFECHSHAHYWYVFLGSMAVACSQSTAVFSLFFFQKTGLDLTQIGRVQSAASLTTALLIVLSGWLADRYHPIRVVLVGQCLQVFVVLPATCIWIFFHPPSQVAYWVWMMITVCLSAPTAALIGVGDPPLLMRLLPKERFGQFCSANAMWRSLGSILGGATAGVYLDTLRRHTDVANVYAFTPIWQLVFYVPAVFATYYVYKSWKRYGGDDAYQPPLPDPRLVISVNVPPPPAIAGTQEIERGIESSIISSEVK